MRVSFTTELYDQRAKTGVAGLLCAENVFLGTPQLGEAKIQAVAVATARIRHAD